MDETSSQPKVIFKSNGNVIIVKSTVDEGTPQESSSLRVQDSTSTSASQSTNQNLQFLTIKTRNTENQKAESQSQNIRNYEESYAEEQKFCLHTFDIVNDLSMNVNINNSSNNGEEIVKKNNDKKLFERLLASASPVNQNQDNPERQKEKRFLMCFSCRLHFELGRAFASHATSEHGVILNDMEKQLLECDNMESIIQETFEKKAIIYFLEPTAATSEDEQTDSQDNKTNTLERHLEKTHTLTDIIEENETDGVSSSVNETDKKEKKNSENVESESQCNDSKELQNDVKMATDTESKDQQIIEDQSSEKLQPTKSNSTKENTSKDENNKVNEEPTNSLQESKSPKGSLVQSDTPDVAKVKIQIQSKAMASETISSSPSLTSTKASKMREAIFNGTGGVATVDPLFQMSLFQSRNSCKTLKCPRCNWHYKYRQTLDAHMKEKHSEDTSDCLYCNANQPHPRLSRGESYACGYKPFKCEVCNYSTTTKGNLSIHNQSDKHLFNLKALQHQQQKDKINGQTATSRPQTNGSTNNQPSGSAIPARLLAEKQEQIQNLLQQQQIQARKRSSPDAGTSKNNAQHLLSKRKNGGKDHSPSPVNASSSSRKATWRCDLCNYETDYSRNLRIHTQSEKHAHNAALARASGTRRVEEIQNSLQDSGGESSGMEDQNETKENESPTTSSALPEQNASSNTMAALYYYLASLQNSMQGNQEKELRQNPNLQEQEKQQKQYLAQQQQLILAQQYQQMFAQLGSGGDVPTGVANPLAANQSTALIQQQLLLQMQLWRQLLARNDGSQIPNTPAIQGSGEMQEMNNSSSTSTKFLFTCGICCNFSCNDLESLCTHVRVSRHPRTPLEESEWVNKSVSDGYLCRLCNYTTQLKTNFSLHCKTEKHTSKLQLVNHIREGGEANEWKVRHAIAGNNMNKVTCNGCRHSATSIDKLRIHCSTDRHQGTLTMCHYLDTMLKEAELGKDLHATSETSRHHLLCRPCSYQSKFVVEMIQHMQCQNHQINVHQEQQSGGGSFADIVCTELDKNDTKNDEIQSDKNDENHQNNDMSDCSDAEDRLVIDQQIDIVEAHKCQFCTFETDEENLLQVHLMTQHNAQSTIKCPMCTEFLDDVTNLQNHLIEVHKLTGEQNPKDEIKNEINEQAISGTLEAVEVPRELNEEKMNDVTETTTTNTVSLNCDEKVIENTEDNFSQKCEQCGDILTSPEKWQLHLKLHEIQVGSETTLLSESPPQDGDAESRQQLSRLCGDSEFLQKSLQDNKLDQILEALEPPFTCSPCEETFVSKVDLMTHLTSLSHKCPEKSGTENRPNDIITKSNVTNDGENKGSTGVENGVEHGKEYEGKNGAESSNFDFSFLSEYKWKRGRLLYPGISKIAHKKILVNVGQDEVAHFVENRMSVNREKALNWKQQNANKNSDVQENDKNNEDTTKNSNKDEKSLSQITRPSSPFSCERCGKGFSNTWILKVHQKSVHNMDMSTEMLEEFVSKYSSWYWECAKKDLEETAKNGGKVDSKNFQTKDDSRKPKELTSDSINQSKTEDNNNFQQAAIQTLLKNYPGLMGSYSGASIPSQTQPSPEEDQSKIQQQMLLQMMITAQAQALQQQQQANVNSQDSNQANASNVMNMLVDHMYGAAMHGATPGFVDPVGIMSLLQQQNRVPTPGVNPYQWLAMRFVQQQQMQQLLMYPGLAGASAGMPFMPSLSENTNQQQMLASFAASLLSSGMAPDSAQSMMNNPMAAALQAYQMQTNNAQTQSPLVDQRPNPKEVDHDIAKAPKVTQREPAPSINQTLQTAELPAKRPRTRITDDQLKILRANFDINISPSENQISEMAEKTGLPSKVIKHWFRNTLFKERQRSKDSPYNFNIPPMTSLDDVKQEITENDNSNSEDHFHSVKMEKQQEETELNLTNSEVTSSDVFNKFQNNSSSIVNDESNETESSNMSAHPSLTERQAMEIIRSLSAGKNTNEGVNQSLLAMSLVPNLPHASGVNDMSLTHASDLNRRITTENDSSNMTYIRESHNDGFGYERPLNSSDFSFPNGHGGVTTIGRRTPRTRFSDYQLKVLQEFFDKNAYPKDEDLDRLSRMLELSTRVIVVWFQNARQKARKSYEMQHGSMNSNPHSISATSLSRFPQRRPSPSTSPLQRFSPNHATNVSHYMLDSVPRYSSESVSYSPKSGDAQRERSASAQEIITYRCRQCSATLKNSEDLRQHEEMHAAQTSSYMNSVLQKCKMIYPSIYNDVSQSSSRKDSLESREDSRRRLSQSSLQSSVKEENRSFSYSKEDGVTEMTSLSKPGDNRTINDVMNALAFSQARNNISKEKIYSHESKNSDTDTNVQNLMSSSQAYNGQRDNIYINKRKMSISPTLSMTSSSSTSPNSTRKNISRNVISDTSKDPKRLRTTITPEQLEFLYKQYLVDSSPSRKVIEQISDIVGLKKRVVQVWFQNTRARERKGQFRSVGRITSVLGVPQPCPHCRVPFRTKADLDAHVRYRHMQSPSAVLPTLPQPSPVTSYQDTKLSSRSRSPNDIILSSSSLHGMTSSSDASKYASQVDNMQDYKEIFTNLSKQLKEKHRQGNLHNSGSISNSMIALESTINKSLASKSIPFGTDEHPSSPKRRRISDETENTKPFVVQTAIPPTSLPISSNYPEHIFGSKSSSVDAIAQKLQTKSSYSTQSDSNKYQAAERYPQHLLQNQSSASSTVPSTVEKYFADKRASLSPPVSSPESLTPSSTSPPFMVPLKRHRTQMSSLQVRSLKHCFFECRTPTLLMCETLGEQIGLPKRVIQVWFQNARAKDKRAKQDEEIDLSECSMQPGGFCRLCPDMRFGSLQDYRNHVFSKKHLQRYVNSYEGGDSDDQSHSSGKRSPSSEVEDVHTPPSTSVIERNSQQYFGSTSITSHDVTKNSYPSHETAVNASGATQPRNQIAGWDASILANPELLQKYQQFAAMQKLMNTGSVSNGVDSDQNIDSNASLQSNNVLHAFKQSWLQQTLLNSRTNGNSETSSFENVHTQAVGEIRDAE